jgi:hypothetical protein
MREPVQMSRLPPLRCGLHMRRGEMEPIYDDVPVPIGMMAFAPVVPAPGAMFGATHRAGAAAGSEPVLTEPDLYGG